MAEKSKWVVRSVQCSGETKTAELLIEWKVQKGKNVLHSVSCNCQQLMDYGGEDCDWKCLERITRKKG